jgi:hypothetical protein
MWPTVELTLVWLKEMSREVIAKTRAISGEIISMTRTRDAVASSTAMGIGSAVEELEKDRPGDEVAANKYYVTYLQCGVKNLTRDSIGFPASQLAPAPSPLLRLDF